MDIELPKTIPKLKISPALVRSKSTWAEVFLLLIVIFLGYWFLVSPKKAEVATQDNQLQDLQKQEVDLEKNLDTLRLLANELKTHTTQLGQLDEGLPLSGNSTELEMLIDNFAQDTGLTVNDVNVTSKGDYVVAGDTKVLADPYGISRSLQKLQATVSVNGNFDNLEAFMKKIETSGRLMDVTSFSINPSSDNTLQLQMFIDSYYYGPAT